MNNNNNKKNKSRQLSKQVKLPSAVSAAAPRRALRLRTENNGDTIIENSEIIVASFTGSAAFSATRRGINPGLSLFAWLSDRAKGFEKYRWEELSFHYVPSASSTATVGSVYLVADFDPSDAAPDSLQILSTYRCQVSGRSWEPITLHVPPNKMFDGIQRKKVRCGPVAGDLQLYDGCSFSSASVDQADSSQIGQLWVSYRVRLISPQTQPATPLPHAFSMYNRSSDQTLTSTTEATVLFDEAVIDGLDITPSSGVFTLPCGMYHITYEVEFRDSANESFSTVLEAQKDSAALNPPSIQNFAVAPGITDCQFTVAGQCYIVSDGTNTFRLRATATGAAGTLKIQQDHAKVSFQLVQ